MPKTTTVVKKKLAIDVAPKGIRVRAPADETVVAEKLTKKVEFPDGSSKKKKPAGSESTALVTIESERKRLSGIYARQMDATEKQFHLISTELHIPDRLSTGTIVGDLLSGGGFCAGTMVQISGLEKGGKSTQCMETLGSALRADVPVIGYWDAENALTDPRYAEAVIKHKVADVFYGVERRARLYRENGLEKFYLSTRALMRRVPDKFYRHDREAWFFVFEADKDGRAQMALYGFSKYDKKLFQETGQLWCQTEQPGLQGIIFCDSYPALVTNDVDESDVEKRGMALNARAFAQYISKVRGVLQRKAFLLVGINQIREKPGVTHGNPEYEPGGNALKFYSDVRMQNRPASVPEGWPKGKTPKGNPSGKHTEEASVQRKGAVDYYNWISIENTKNKTGTPGLGAMARIWYKDFEGKAHGYDPVFDTYQYYKMTGRVEGTRKKFKITGVKTVDGFVFDWTTFKALILSEFFDDKVLATSAGFDKAAPKLRGLAFRELRTGLAYTKLVTSASPDEDDADDLEAGDDDE